MKIQKMVCCCGNGLGSSLILAMNLKKILAELKRSDIEVSHSSLSDFSESNADVFLIGMDLKPIFKEMPRVIALQNIVSKDELREKVQKALQESNEHYWIQ